MDTILRIELEEIGKINCGSAQNEKIGSDSVCVGIRKFPFVSRGRREIVLKILEIDESNPMSTPDQRLINLFLSEHCTKIMLESGQTGVLSVFGR